MDVFTLDSFKDNNGAVKENNYFLIIVFLRGIGSRIKPQEKGD